MKSVKSNKMSFGVITMYRSFDNEKPIAVSIEHVIGRVHQTKVRDVSRSVNKEDINVVQAIVAFPQNIKFMLAVDFDRAPFWTISCKIIN